MPRRAAAVAAHCFAALCCAACPQSNPLSSCLPAARRYTNRCMPTHSVMAALRLSIWVLQRQIYFTRKRSMALSNVASRMRRVTPLCLMMRVAEHTCSPSYRLAAERMLRDPGLSYSCACSNAGTYVAECLLHTMNDMWKLAGLSTQLPTAGGEHKHPISQMLP